MLAVVVIKQLFIGGIGCCCLTLVVEITDRMGHSENNEIELNRIIKQLIIGAFHTVLHTVNMLNGLKVHKCDHFYDSNFELFTF